MSNDALTTSARAVRDAIDFRRLPWIRPLLTDYIDDFPRVASLFAGNPADPAAWAQTVARVRRRAIDRSAVWHAIASQQAAREAPAAARAAALSLASPDAVAVVTGQQAGVFGGPLYTLLKAVTTIQTARRVSAAHGVDAIPVFWVEDEDHDWAEIRGARVLDAGGDVVTVEAPDPPGAGRLPVSRLQWTHGIDPAIDQLASVLAPTEFSAEVIGSLRRRYREGRSVSASFAGWLEDLLGGQGLVVFEAADPGAKTLAAAIFARELGQPGHTVRLSAERARAMTALGHPPQVQLADGTVSVFYTDDAGRHAVRPTGDGFQIGTRTVAARALVTEALEHPARFSPNVLLRPIVQDRLLPTVAYVAGPAELAYQAQLGAAYEYFEVEPPLLVSRATATILDSAAVRFFERTGLPLESLRAQDDGALNALLARQLPAELETSIDELDRLADERRQTLRALVGPLDPTLEGAVDTTIDRMRDAVKTLRAKVVQAAKRKDDTLRRQFLRTRNLSFPGGDPQERALGLVFFANRYGLDIGSRLIDALPAATDKHVVLTL